MGKGKPRWYPEKRQNQLGDFCDCYDAYWDKDGTEHFITCEARMPLESIKRCKGNKHFCKKAQYAMAASRSDKQKLIDWENEYK